MNFTSFFSTRSSMAFLRRPSFSSYRPELDGMRGVAILAVLFNHCFDSFLPGGYLGVDIFFALSGFVVARSLLCRVSVEADSVHGFLIPFYARRIRRLYPALLLMILVVSLLASFFLTPADSAYQASWRTGLGAIWGASNLQLWRTASDYFAAPVSFNLFTHTWSLGVEEQFYLLFPLLWLCFKRRFLFTAIGALTLSSWILFNWTVSFAPISAFYLLPTRFWELGCGVLLALCPTRLVESWPWIRNRYLQGAAFALLIFLLFYQSQPGLITSLVIVLTCYLILGLDPVGGLGRILAGNLLVSLGLLSYSLYLWHWPVLLLTRATFDVAGTSFFWLVMVIALSFALAVASYLLVESPIRSKLSASLPAMSLIVGASLSSFNTLILWTLANPASGSLYLGKSIGDSATSASLGSHQVAPSACNLFTDSASMSFSAEDCKGVSPARGKPTLYLLGDSHVEQFFFAASRFVRNHRWGLRIAVANSCPFPSTLVATPQCLLRQQEVEKQLLSRVKRGDVILAGSSWLSLLNDNYPDESTPALMSIKGGFRRLASSLRDRGAYLILYLDGPQFMELGQTSPSRCSKEWFRPAVPMGCELPVGEFLDQRAPLSRVFRDISRDPGVEVWDPLVDIKCLRGICKPYGYIDGTHFSVEMATQLFDQFAGRSVVLGIGKR